MTVSLPSVQSLFIEMRFSGEKLATGTGFVCDSPQGPVLVTNRHNLSGRNCETGKPISPTGGIPNEVLILHNQKGKLGSWIQVTEALVRNDGCPLWSEHPRLKNKADFVALPLTQLADVDLYKYSMAETGPEIQVGPSDYLSVVGFPFGLRGGGCLAIWATGFLATELDVDQLGLPIVLVDCRARPGQSGSAVIAHRNGGMVAMKDGSTAAFSGPVTKFIGIYSGRINNESDLGIVWKASAIKEMLESMR
jgi:hypothetical protein